MANIHNKRMAATIKSRFAAFGSIRHFRGRDRRHDAAAGERVIRAGPVLLAPPQATQNVGKGFAKAAATPVAWRQNDPVVYWGFALFGIKARWRRSRTPLRVVGTSPLRVTDESHIRRVNPWDLRYVRDDDLHDYIDQ